MNRHIQKPVVCDPTASYHRLGPSASQDDSIHHTYFRRGKAIVNQNLYVCARVCVCLSVCMCVCIYV